MVQIKTFVKPSLRTIENEINLWIETQITMGCSYIIKEIKIDQTEHNYFAYIIYDNTTFTENSKAEMWF